MNTGNKMIVVPRQDPVQRNLNSYYVDLKKLLEHFQGELDAGGIHVKSPTAEGAIFFDDNDVLNSIFQTRGRTFEGRTAMGHIINNAGRGNFSVAVYRIDPEHIYFWSNISKAESVHRDLSAEFTDLDGLIKKMGVESLTGYIEVTVGEGPQGGSIFFYNGRIIGSANSWMPDEALSPEKARLLLVQKARLQGGSINVRRVPLAGKRIEMGWSADNDDGRTAPGQPERRQLLEMIGQLLSLFEQTVQNSKSIKEDFNTLIRRQFMQRADVYDFLDPFAAEFEYRDGSVRFSGAAPLEKVVSGVWANVRELSAALGVARRLQLDLKPWRERYGPQIDRIGLPGKGLLHP